MFGILLAQCHDESRRNSARPRRRATDPVAGFYGHGAALSQALQRTVCSSARRPFRVVSSTFHATVDSTATTPGTRATSRSSRSTSLRVWSRPVSVTTPCAHGHVDPTGLDPHRALEDVRPASPARSRRPVRVKARTRSARVTMPTSEPSFTTGSRLTWRSLMSRAASGHRLVGGDRDRGRGHRLPSGRAPSPWRSRRRPAMPSIEPAERSAEAALARVVLLVEDVALGDDAEHVALDVADRQAGDPVVDEDLRDVLDRRLRPDREDVAPSSARGLASCASLRRFRAESSAPARRRAIGAGAEPRCGKLRRRAQVAAAASAPIP